MQYTRNKAWLAALLTFFGMGIATMNAALPGEVIGWMEIVPRDGLLQITGRAYSAQPMAIDYMLQIQRSGRSGNTTSQQGGKATLNAGEAAVLSTTSVNSQSGDQLAILLTIFRDGKVLATSGIHVGDLKD
jgi:hypothetical protein